MSDEKSQVWRSRLVDLSSVITRQATDRANTIEFMELLVMEHLSLIKAEAAMFDKLAEKRAAAVAIADSAASPAGSSAAEGKGNQ
jgi:hypothetical protein